MNKIINGDAFEFIKSLDDNSIDACITDPPYFIDGLGDEWDKDAIDKKYKTWKNSINFKV